MNACTPGCHATRLQVRFKHVDTHALLYSHEHRFQQPIAGQQEVCCKRGRDRNSDWQAAEGVYIPKDEALPGGKDEL